MNAERLASILFSLCLHLGLLVLALFWPAPQAPTLELPQGKLIPNLVTLGKAGKDVAGGRQAVPEAARGRTDKQPAGETPRTPGPEPTPPPRAETPTPPPPPGPEVKAAEKPVEKAAPDAVPIPKKVDRTPPGPEVKAPEKPVEKPVEKPDAAPVPKKADRTPPKATDAAKADSPAKTAAGKPAEEKKKPDDNLGSALADLNRQVGSSRGRTGGRGTAAGKGQDLSSALADLDKKTAGSAGGAASGQGPGGRGGDGYGVLGAYQDSIVSRVRPNWSWPGRTDRKNYTAVVNIRIEPDGAIKNARIVTSSGNAYFDATVLQALAATTNLEPPPDPAYADINIRFSPETLGAR